MPTIKLVNTKSTIITSGITSSNVSSSVNGNMELIQSQINEKSNSYINIKNAVKILEKYSNWNGYIKIYTEIENNFNVDDIIYITYSDPNIINTTIFNLDNNYNNTTQTYYYNPFDENISQFSFGYKILYVNKYKNELVINRYYNDITPGSILSNQYLSKVSCKGGNFFNNISDGAVFFGGLDGSTNLRINIFSGNFSIVQGIVYGNSVVTGATILCAGLSDTTDQNGFYTLNTPVGSNIFKCRAPGFITQTVTTTIFSNQINILNFTLTGGTNSISISSDNQYNAVCVNGSITFYAQTVGYDEPVQFQWKIYRGGNWLDMGTDNAIFSFNQFQNNDLVRCEVRDDYDIIHNTFTTSNQINVTITPKIITIVPSPLGIITYGTLVTFTANAPCYSSSIYEWRINESIVIGQIGATLSSSTLNNGDNVYCKVLRDSSNHVIMSVLPAPPTTTTTTTVFPTTTMFPSTTMMPTTTMMPLGFYEVFGQLYNLS